MDITTLAAANAYTDKKVKEGGGSGGGGGLPVVELETFPTLEGVAMSANDNAKLSAVIGAPVIINVKKDDNEISAVFSYLNEGGIRLLVTSFGLFTVMFQSTDGETWNGMQFE